MHAELSSFLGVITFLRSGDNYKPWGSSLRYRSVCLFRDGSFKVPDAVLKRWKRNLGNLRLIRDGKIPVTDDCYQKILNSQRIQELNRLFAPGYITYVQYLPDYNIAFALQVNDDSSHDNFSLKKYFNTIKKIVLSHNYPTSVKRE